MNECYVYVSSTLPLSLFHFFLSFFPAHASSSQCGEDGSGRTDEGGMEGWRDREREMSEKRRGGGWFIIHSFWGNFLVCVRIFLFSFFFLD